MVIDYDKKSDLGLYQFWIDWLTHYADFLEFAEVIGGDTYSRSPQDYPLYVIRAKFADSEINLKLEKAGISQYVDILVTGITSHEKYINKYFDFGICKVYYDRFGPP